MKKGIVVRNATRKDLMRVVELEQSIFGAEGLVPFCYKHFATCLEAYPQGFFVAEENGSIVGYVYAQIIYFNPHDPVEITKWTSFDAIIGSEVLRASHKPNGDYHLGINIGSISPGAGKLLVDALVSLGQCTGKPVLGMSRVSGLRTYLQSLKYMGIDIDSMYDERRHAIALAYVLQSATLVGGAVRLMESCPGVAHLSSLQLPTVSVRDPVLCKYLLNKAVAVFAILPNFLNDPASAHYAVLIGPA